MRVYALYLVVALLCVYAYRDWFKSLCGLLLMMAVIEHPDMPKSIMGIQGLNPWNILLLNVLLAWSLKRREEGLTWDMPRHITGLLIVVLGVVVVGLARALLDRSYIEDVSTGQLISENLVNTVKWIIPALLLYDGCRSRSRLAWGTMAILGIYVLLALQVARWMPMGQAISGDELTARSRKIIMNEVGYHAVNMSMILAGGSWAILATLPVVRRNAARMGIILAACLVAYGQALTAGRMGYATWVIIGLCLCTLKWRKLLLIMPFVLIGIVVAMPGVSERMLGGFGAVTVSGEAAISDYEVTSGRTTAWPIVIDRIMDSPLVGHGRLAMARTGTSEYLWTEYGESFPHPHSAYLQWMLDNGIVGFVPIMLLFGFLTWYATRAFLWPRHPWVGVVGGMSLALMMALLVASLGSQTFYPREGAVGMLAAIGLLMRVTVQQNAMVPQRA